MRPGVAIILLLACAGASAAAGLSGNWVVSEPAGDGYVRKTYFNLKQDGSRIKGTIRVRQFYYTVVDSTGTPDGFTLTGAMKDGDSERRAVYEGRLVGDELRIGERRNNVPQAEMVAHLTSPGEGRMPARLPLPALHKVRDNGLVRTPPMGWNSWNKFAGRVSAEVVRGIADAIATNGMREAGYVYINIDDTWEGGRDSLGNIRSNNKFPDMKALADYVHGKGLKLGIYSSPGPNTCAGYEGSYGHEEQDASTYAAWGIDYLKYDWCGARNLYSDAEMQRVYQKMGDALLATRRSIVYSLCQYGRADVWKWGPEVGANLWRTTGDIRDRWESMERIGFAQEELAPYAGPGHWNDPDMLEIGNSGMTDTEYRTHMSLWSMLAAPLIAGNDVRSMTQSIADILMNREVIAIDQDPAGMQARRVSKSGDQEIWVRPLAHGDRAIAFFNRGDSPAEMGVNWADVGLPPAPATVRDLWAHRDVVLSSVEHKVTVPSHGVLMWRVR
jgi:alpha-galactosidase